MSKMGITSSQVQEEKELDPPQKPALATPRPTQRLAAIFAAKSTEAAAHDEESKPGVNMRSTEKPPLRTYAKRKRPVSPEILPMPLNSTSAQDKSGSAKRRRWSVGRDDGAGSVGKENRVPESSSAATSTSSSSSSSFGQEEDGGQTAEKKAAAAPSTPSTTQHSARSTPRQGRERPRKMSSEQTLNRKISQRLLETRLLMPEQTFQPGHVSEKNDKKTGWFSPAEIKKLEEYKASFCRENGIDGGTFDQCIQASGKDRFDFFRRHLRHTSYTEFWKAIYTVLPNRDRRSIARFMRRHFAAGHKPYKWTEADDDELQRLHQLHGPKWSVIASEMERTQDDVVQRWKNKVEHRSTMRNGAWTKEEVEKLIRALEKSREFLAAENHPDLGRDIYEMPDKHISWGAVSNYFGNTRSRQQCADKWRKVRARVADARQTGSENATYLEVYDFSVPRSQRTRTRSRSKSEQPTAPSSSSTRKRRKPISSDFVHSDDDASDAGSDHDILDSSMLEGQNERNQPNEPNSTSPANEEERRFKKQEEVDEEEQSIPHHHHADHQSDNPPHTEQAGGEVQTPQTPSPSSQYFNPAIATPSSNVEEGNQRRQQRQQQATDDQTISSESKAQSKSELKAQRKAERKAQRKAERKAQRKAERKAARRAKKLAKLQEQQSLSAVAESAQNGGD